MSQDNLQTVGTGIVAAVQILTPLVTAAAGVPNGAAITEGVNIAIAALQKLIADHNITLTFGDLEDMRLKPTWADPK